MPKDNKWPQMVVETCSRVFVDAVRFVLGCAGPLEPLFSLLPFGMGMVALHASCCGLGEATRGHDVVVHFVHAAVKSCDPCAEPNMLGPATRMCPAQTRWLPHQQGAGGECSRANMLVAGTTGDVDCLSHPDQTHFAQT